MGYVFWLESVMLVQIYQMDAQAIALQFILAMIVQEELHQLQWYVKIDVKILEL